MDYVHAICTIYHAGEGPTTRALSRRDSLCFAERRQDPLAINSQQVSFNIN